MSLNKWSQTAATNATADATINWAEGQAPSSVNDSARALMAAAAKGRDDWAGSLTTGGTSTAYTLTSNQVFASLSAMSGHKVTFKAHATSGASPTLNVDSLGAKALKSVSGTALPTGSLLEGGIYTATYSNSANEWILHGYLAFQPLDATLTALAGVTTAANQIIYATGSDTFSTSTLSAYGLTLIDDSSAATARGTLGLGTASTEAVSTSGATIPLLNGNNTHSGNNTFSGNNTYSGTNTFSNAAGVAARNTPKAFCYFTTNGSSVPTLQSNSFNVTQISSVSVSGSSGFRVVFNTALSGSTYTFNCRANGTGGSALVFPALIARTTAHVEFILINTSSVLVTASLAVDVEILENA